MIKYRRKFRRLHRLIWRALALMLLFSILLQNMARSAYCSFLMESGAVIVSPPVELEEGTAGKSIIDANCTSAETSVDPFFTYYPKGYDVLTGAYVSGSVPTSVESIDSDYFVVQSAASSQSSTSYNPSGYNLLDSTTLDSGSASNLAVDDSSYMTFTSHASNFSGTENNAFIAYQAGADAAKRVPKYRAWNGSAWSDQGLMPSAGNPLRWFRTVYSSVGERYHERIVVTLSDDRYLDAYVWTGSEWSTSSNIGQVGAMSVDTRSYDVEYEKTSGKCLLVWSTGGATVDMKYKVWDGAAWSDSYTLDISGTASGTDVYWIAMAQNPTANSNELALIGVDGTNSDVYGLIWNGTAWGNEQQLETDLLVTTEEAVAVAYEQTSGHAFFVWVSSSHDMESRQWKGTVWEASPTTFDPSGPETPKWIALKSDPASDRLMLVVVDSAFDLNTADWNGTDWAAHTEHDDQVNTDSARCADLDWEPSGSKALLVWATDTTNLSWKTWTPAGGWTSQSDFDYAGTEAVWIQLRRDTGGVGEAKIFASASDVNLFGFVVKWNGTALSDSVTFTTTITATTYENFDLAFQNFGEPNEYTIEVEFTGTSNTGIWTQLNWTIDSAWDTASISVAMQLYNYSLGAYSTGGDGYMAYTSSSTANTDENKNQPITTNPEDFKDLSGNWKVKVKGVKSTSAPFKLKTDWMEFKPTYYSEYTVSTEFTFLNMTTDLALELAFTIVGQYDLGSINVTIQIYNYTGSAYPTSGEGHLSYISSSSPSTDETKLISITSNPQDFISSGNATIKITGVGKTPTQFQQNTNQLQLNCQTASDFDFDYVLRAVEQDGSDWKVRLNAYNQSNIDRLDNCSIYVYNGSNSTQIIILSGAYNQQTGAWYDLNASDTIYIGMHVEVSSAGTSYIYTYLEILVPDTTIYARYIITFEIT